MIGAFVLEKRRVPLFVVPNVVATDLKPYVSKKAVRQKMGETQKFTNNELKKILIRASPLHNKINDLIQEIKILKDRINDNIAKAAN